mmetsp:Transcript_69479/g.219921  ORF Transcript_69479/g.219921 Transcript_69479/m.219921 type:complete len:290 (-) Transcript_69479:1511-2380(-)
MGLESCSCDRGTARLEFEPLAPPKLLFFQTVSSSEDLRTFRVNDTRPMSSLELLIMLVSRLLWLPDCRPSAAVESRSEGPLSSDPDCGIRLGFPRGLGERGVRGWSSNDSPLKCFDSIPRDRGVPGSSRESPLPFREEPERRLLELPLRPVRRRRETLPRLPALSLGGSFSSFDLPRTFHAAPLHMLRLTFPLWIPRASAIVLSQCSTIRMKYWSSKIALRGSAFTRCRSLVSANGRATPLPRSLASTMCANSYPMLSSKKMGVVLVSLTSIRIIFPAIDLSCVAFHSG